MRLFKILGILILTVLPPVAFSANERLGDRVKGQLLVQHRNSLAVAKTTARQSGAKLKAYIPAIKTMVLEVPESALERVKRAISQSGNFTVVEYDHIAEVVETPNDEKYPSQWHLPYLQLPGAWSTVRGSQAVPVAILDTGIDASHEDLYGKVRPGVDFVQTWGGSDVSDLHGHGTSVAGSAAAMTNNLDGVAGAGWDTPIVPMRVANAEGWASYSAISAAIIRAANDGVRVISISISGSSPSSSLESAVNYAWSKGAVVFAAAGNNSSSTPQYPAAYDQVVAVGSIGPSGTKSSFSNYGSWVALVAPGENILTTQRYGGYRYASGTSFSTPLTAGIAALVLSANFNLEALEMVSLLEQTADDLGASGFDGTYGWGRVNADAAVNAALNGGAPPPTEEPPAEEPPTQEPPAENLAPTATIESPSDGTTVKKKTQVTGSATDDVEVTRIDLKIDGQVAATWRDSSFRYSWSPSLGDHTIELIAYDEAGNTGSHAIRVVRVK